MKTISRRALLAGSAVGALSLTTAGLTGCFGGEPTTESPKSETIDFDLENKYLPLGSVVKLKLLENTDIYWMIVGRRPRTVDGDKTVQYDYDAIPWPLGFLYCDASENEGSPRTARCIDKYLMNSDIASVLFLGFENDRETQANDALMAGKAADLDGTDSLKDLIDDYNDQFSSALDSIAAEYGSE